MQHTGRGGSALDSVCADVVSGVVTEAEYPWESGAVSLGKTIFHGAQNTGTKPVSLIHCKVKGLV